MSGTPLLGTKVNTEGKVNLPGQVSGKESEFQSGMSLQRGVVAEQGKQRREGAYASGNDIVKCSTPHVAMGINWLEGKIAGSPFLR